MSKNFHKITCQMYVILHETWTDRPTNVQTSDQNGRTQRKKINQIIIFTSVVLCRGSMVLVFLPASFIHNHFGKTVAKSENF